MFRSRARGALFAALVTLAGSGCDSESTPSTVPTPVPIIEPDFTGRLNINGAVTQTFTVGIGTITVLINTLEPGDDPTVGVALGVWNGTGCALSITNDNAGIGAGVLGNANGPATACVRIYDVGKLTETVNFSVRIEHF